MKELMSPPSQTGDRLYVAGARLGSGNIGAAITEYMYVKGWVVQADDCATVNHPEGKLTRAPGQNLNPETARQYGYEPTGEGGYYHYSAPGFDDFRRFNADALVVTLGKTYKGHFADITDGDIRNILQANLVTPLEAVRRFVQATESNRRAEEDRWAAEEEEDGLKYPNEHSIRKIVLTGSYAHRHPFTNGTLYCAAKAGLDMAAKTLGWELTDLGYRVFVVHPYHVQGTPMWEQVEKDVMASKGMTLEEADAYNRKDLKMPDLLTPGEVAEVVGTLLTVESMDWLSGTAIELNGGSR